MFDTSKDILFIVIAVAVGLLTIFIVWALYYIVMMLKKANQVVNEFKEMIDGIKEKISRLENIFNTIEDKISNSAAYLPLIMKGVTEIINYFKRKKEAKKNKKQKAK